MIIYQCLINGISKAKCEHMVKIPVMGKRKTSNIIESYEERVVDSFLQICCIGTRWCPDQKEIELPEVVKNTKTGDINFGGVSLDDITIKPLKEDANNV